MSNSETTGHRRRPVLVAAAVLAGAAIMVVGLLTPPRATAEPQAAPSPQATGYLPSISDLMIATIQPRHERLWQSEQDGNWEFAAYELGNLHGAFERLGIAHPIEHDISFPDMIVSATEQPFQELKAAIRSKDSNAFAKAYAGLTNACNSCHQGLNHGTVEIRVPNRTSASDLNAISTPRN
jgi:hypothetical protein